MAKETLASLRKCMRNTVYHATLDDGRTIRATVWQRADAPQKGFDWEACRRTVLGFSDMAQPARPTYCAGAYFNMPPTYAEQGRKIISAHIEQYGEVLADDPLAAPAKKARRASLKQPAGNIASALDQIAKLLEVGANPADQAIALRSLAQSVKMLPLAA